ncbi:MAG: hypothetical protein Kow0074_21490 [Candidatus Zixiibacteriota bacterium]
MNRLPRWSVWSGAAVALWLLWFVWLYGRMSDGADTARRDRDEARQKLAALQARVAAVPDLTFRLDSALSELESSFEQYRSVDQLDALMRDLTADARRTGVLTAVAAPDLQSILELDSPLPGTVNDLQCDTLLVELSATSDFVRIGRWLDVIEQRADFQHWMECRWSDGGEGNAVRFEGLLSLLVVKPRQSGLARMGVNNGR